LKVGKRSTGRTRSYSTARRQKKVRRAAERGRPLGKRATAKKKKKGPPDGSRKNRFFIDIFTALKLLRFKPLRPKKRENHVRKGKKREL